MARATIRPPRSVRRFGHIGPHDDLDSHMASAVEECLAGRAKVAAGDPALARLRWGSGYIVRAAIRAHFPPADSGPLDRTTIRAATWLLRRRNAWPAGRRVQQVTPHLPGSSGAKALCKGFLVRAAIRAPWGVERFGPIGPRDDSGSWFARRGAGHIGSPGVEQVHRLARRFGLPGPRGPERGMVLPTPLALCGPSLLLKRSNQRMQWTATFVTVLALSRGSNFIHAS